MNDLTGLEAIGESQVASDVIADLTHLDAFSGICGFALAAFAAGFLTVGFIEQSPYRQRVISKLFPGRPIHGDIRTIDARPYFGVDLLTAGFPCQDVSQANKHAEGITGKRSGLVHEALRVVDECSPLFVVFENSPMLKTRGFDTIAAALESRGYSCEPFVVGAVHANGPHNRQRAFIVAHLNEVGSIPQRTRYRRSALGANELGVHPLVREGRASILRGSAPIVDSCAWVLRESLDTPIFSRAVDELPDRVDRVAAGLILERGTCKSIPFWVNPEFMAKYAQGRAFKLAITFDEMEGEG